MHEHSIVAWPKSRLEKITLTDGPCDRLILNPHFCCVCGLLSVTMNRSTSYVPRLRSDAIYWVCSPVRAPCAFGRIPVMMTAVLLQKRPCSSPVLGPLHLHTRAESPPKLQSKVNTML